MTARKKESAEAPSPVYVVYGPEDFLKLQAVNEFAERVLAGADRALGLNEHDGSTAILAAVLDDLRTLPFLTERRLVIVREADPFITRYRPGLESYLQNPVPTGVLLLECQSFPGTTRLYKRVSAIGTVLKCDSVPPGRIPSWLSERARQTYGVELDPRAAAMLGELIGSDLGQLVGELEKLSLYVGERKRIEAADVEALVGHYKEEKVWRILSAIAAGDLAGALQRWEEVWQTDRAASARAVAGIAFTVRRLLNAKRAQQNGASLGELARLMWTDERQAKAELSAFSTEQLEDMLCKLLEADLAGKTGLGSVQSKIEAFIVQTCRPRKTRRAAAS